MKPLFQKAELQQILLQAIGPADIPEKKNWQEAFYITQVQEPIKGFLEKFEFEKETPFSEKLTSALAFLNDDLEKLSYCATNISAEYLERLTNINLKFLKPIWYNQEGYSKPKAIAAIRALVYIEIAYFYLEELKSNESLEKGAYEAQLQAAISRVYTQFKNQYAKDSWSNKLLRVPSLRASLESLQKAYHQSYLKKDLHLLFNLKNLFRQDIASTTFWKNLLWVSFRMFRLSALALPSILFYLYIESIILLTQTINDFSLNSLDYLKQRLHTLCQNWLPAIYYQRFWLGLVFITNASICLFAFSLIFFGFSWFTLLASSQGFGLLLNTTILAPPQSGLSALMLHLTNWAGPLMWIGIPLGALSSCLTFIGIGCIGSLFLPLKRLFRTDNTSPIDALKNNIAENNRQFYHDLAHQDGDFCLMHPVYVDSAFQVCLTTEELNDIKKISVLPRYDLLSNGVKDFLSDHFTRLKSYFDKNPHINKVIINPTSQDNLQENSMMPINFDYQAQGFYTLHFNLHREDNLTDFKRKLMEGLAQHNIEIKEAPIPRL